MRLSSRSSCVTASLTALLLLLGTAGSAAAQTGSISGRVTAKESAAPLGDVRVVLLAGSNFAITNADGRYTLRNVPSGGVDLRVLRVGYAEQKKRVTLTPGQSEIVNFEMEQTIVRLQEVVTTATGDQRRVELGNTVATLDVARRVQEAPVKNFGDLLAAKMPGVQILPSNMTGGGSRVRVRGTSSLNLSNDPIYIIDGIRMTSTGSNLAVNTGGTAPSRVNDINPEEIENIEIVKGPSAATLYGTAAANGVVVITTKKGRAGAPRWNVFGENGQIHDRNDYPGQYAILGHLPATPTVARKCLLKEVSLGTCIMDSTSVLNVFKDKDITPLKVGQRRHGGIQLQGGTEAIRYFVSGDVQKEFGPFGMPAFGQRRYDSLEVKMEDHWVRPSNLDQQSVRANLNIAVSPTLDLAVSSGFTSLDQRFPQVDNNINSIWYNGMMGPGFKGAGPGYTGVGSLGQPLYGYLGFTPAEIFQRLTTQNVQRFIGSTNFNWRPLRWLAARGDFGVDLTDRVDQSQQLFASGPDFGTQRLGSAQDSRGNTRNLTWNMGGTGTWQPLPWLNAKTSVGMQYVNELSHSNSASGTQLPPGAQTVSQATVKNASTSTGRDKTLGVFIDEQVAIRDRLFLTAAVRTDQNSAFGTSFQRVYYPKGSVSWIASEETFFPRVGWLDQLRLRMSAGSAGVQPNQNDQLRTFGTTTTSIAGGDVSGLQSAAPGNAFIRPERTTEFEGGFDARLWNSRINFELTYYNKKTKDALFSEPIAPSAGSAATSIRKNLGGTQNTGVEALVNAQLMDARSFGWDVTVAASHNSNKLISLGQDATGKDLPTISPQGNVQQRNGFPLNGYWGRPFKYADASGDGIIVPTEVVVDTGFFFQGYSQPRDEVSLTNGFELLGRRLRITMLVDYKGGSNLNNNEQGFLCTQSTSCPYTSSLGASLYNQARTIARRDFGSLNTGFGFNEPLRFWRLRELSASYTLSAATAQRYLRSRSASVNFGVRNLKVWTAYTGVDPEANYSQGDTQATLLTAGPPTYFTLRINLGY